MQPTPTISARAGFNPGLHDTICDALDYAATGECGMNFYSARGDLVDRMPYAELRDEARMTARRFAALGLERCDRVMLLAETDRHFIINLMGAMYAGLLPAPVPIPVLFGEKDDYVDGLRRRIDNADSGVMIGPDGLLDLMREACEHRTMRLIAGVREFESLAAGDSMPGPNAAREVAYLQYSSGSTRSPAGVEITHHALMSNVRGIIGDGLKGRSGDRAVSWLPLYHDMGLVGFFFVPLGANVSVDMMATRDFARRPMTWLKMISQNRGTMAYSPSFGYELCVRQGQRADLSGLDLSSWRCAGIGGDMVRARILDEFAEIYTKVGFKRTSFVPSYGLAEATLALTFAPDLAGARYHRLDRAALDRGDVVFADADASDLRARTFVGCGSVIGEHVIEVRDEFGAPAASGKIGRIFARGASLMRGYFRNPEATHRALSVDGWLDTGDLGFIEDGDLVITGRAKDLIIVNGRNIWPQDIEWQIEAEPGVRRGDACVFSVDLNGRGESVVALVQCRSADPAIRQSVQAGAESVLRKAGLGDFDVHLVAAGALPQTSSGKLSRAKAKLLFLDGAFFAAANDANGQERASVVG